MNRLFFDRFGQLYWLWKAVIIVFGTIFANILLTVLFLTSAANVIATQQANALEAFSEANLLATQMEIQTILQIVTMGIMLGLVIWLVRKVERRALNWRWLGLPRLRQNWRPALAGAGLGLALGLACCVGAIFEGSLHFAAFGGHCFTLPQMLNTLFYTAALAAAIAVAEEVTFRGYLLKRLAARNNPMTALLITSAVFAIAHPWDGGNGVLLTLTRTGLMGLLLGLLYLRTGSCWAGIFAYGVWNFLHTGIIGTHPLTDVHFFGAPLVLLERVTHNDALLDVILMAGAVVLVAYLPRLLKHKPGGLQPNMP